MFVILLVFLFLLFWILQQVEYVTKSQVWYKSLACGKKIGTILKIDVLGWMSKSACASSPSSVLVCYELYSGFFHPGCQELLWANVTRVSSPQGTVDLWNQGDTHASPHGFCLFCLGLQLLMLHGLFFHKGFVFISVWSLTWSLLTEQGVHSVFSVNKQFASSPLTPGRKILPPCAPSRQVSSYICTLVPFCWVEGDVTVGWIFVPFISPGTSS